MRLVFCFYLVFHYFDQLFHIFRFGGKRGDKPNRYIVVRFVPDFKSANVFQSIVFVPRDVDKNLIGIGNARKGIT